MKNKPLLIIYLLILTVIMSCGGGGGGGGAVSFSGSNELHNGGDAGGWGSGNTTGGGIGGNGFSGSSSSDGLLFETVPSFFSPIDHIDISLIVNGSPVEITGLDIYAKKEVLGVSNGDKISGTAVITLADGSTRNAALAETTIGINTQLSFAVTFRYILCDSAGNAANVEGTYTTAGGINVSGITWMCGGYSIECWKTDSGTAYAAGGVISGVSGDVVLTAYYPAVYTYTLVDSSGINPNITGTYTSSGGIDVSGITWTNSNGGSVLSWQSDTGVDYIAGGIITNISGNITLTANYTVVQMYTYTLIDSTSAQPNIVGTYTAAGGINVAGITWTGPMSNPVSKWKSDTGTVYTPDANGRITGITGDITLTAYYANNYGMPQGHTLFRYGPAPAVANLPGEVCFTLPGGVPPFTATATINGVATNAVTLTQTSSSGYTSVAVAVNNSYGINAGETIADTATANGAEIRIRIEDNSGDVIDDSVHLVDCIENTSTGIKLNTNNTLVVNNATSFTIPDSGYVNGDAIGTAIPNDAFRNSTGLGSIALPSTITTISAGTMSGTHPYANAQGAFSGSSITSLTATGLRTIGNGSFTNSSISTIDLSSVTTIGRYAFTGCTGLSSVNLSSLTTLSGSAFADCSSLSSVTWWGAGGPSTIPERAFDGTALTSSSFTSFPSIVTTIENKAFANTGITDISWLFDTSVNTIADDAFDGCSLSGLTVPDTITDITSVMPKFKNLGITEVTFSGLTTVGANTFKDFTSLETITITGSELVMYAVPGGPDASRSKWGSNIFTNCSSLQTIDCTSCSEVHYTGGVLPNSGAFASSGVVKLGTSLSRLVLGACSVQPGMHFEYAGSSTELLPGGSVNTERYGGPTSSTDNGNVKVHCLSDDVWLEFSDTSISWTVTTAP